MHDKELNNFTIRIGLKNNANLFQNVRGNFYTGMKIKEVPKYLEEIIKKFLKFIKWHSLDFKIFTDIRRIETGLCQGASDNIGFTVVPVKYLPQDGSVAVFTAIENKEKKEPFREGQREFLAMVSESGGIAGVNRDGVFEWVSDIKWRETCIK